MVFARIACARFRVTNPPHQIFDRDLAVFVPLIPAGPDDKPRVTALLEQLETLAMDTAISKVVSDLRGTQVALARLSRWSRRVERKAAAPRTAISESMPIDLTISSEDEEKEGEGGGKRPRARQPPVVIDVEAEEAEQEEESGGGGGGSGASSNKRPVAFLALAHDLSRLYEEVGPALSLSLGGDMRGAGQQPLLPLEEPRPHKLTEMLQGLIGLGRLSRTDCDPFLALDAVMKHDEENDESPGDYQWGERPKDDPMLDEWAAEEGQQGADKGKAGTDEEAAAAPRRAPATLPTQMLYFDRTSLLHAVARLAHVAKAYCALVGGRDAPQAQELLRPVATYRFRWDLDTLGVAAPSPVAGNDMARWRALCLDNAWRETTRLLVQLQPEGSARETPQEQAAALRVLRVEWPHVNDARLMAVFTAFWARWRQAWAGGGRPRGPVKRGRRQRAQEREEVEWVLMAAHRHRGGRLFLSSGLVYQLVDRWEGHFVGEEAGAGVEEGWEWGAGRSEEGEEQAEWAGVGKKSRV